MRNPAGNRLKRVANVNQRIDQGWRLAVSSAALMTGADKRSGAMNINDKLLLADAQVLFRGHEQA